MRYLPSNGMWFKAAVDWEEMAEYGHGLMQESVVDRARRRSPDWSPIDFSRFEESYADTGTPWTPMLERRG